MHPPPTRIAAAVAFFAACLTTAASDDTAASRLHVTHDETTGEPDYAGIMLLDRTGDGTGHASLTCLDHQPAPELIVLVYEPRSAERLAEYTSETLRVHVDAQPTWCLRPVAVADVPQTDDRRGTVMYGVTLRRGFLWELAAGERLIVQIGELPIVSLDVAAAKPDIVESKAACDRMYANRMLPRHRWAELDFPDPDPVTGRLWLSLQVFKVRGNRTIRALRRGGATLREGKVGDGSERPLR